MGIQFLIYCSKIRHFRRRTADVLAHRKQGGAARHIPRSRCNSCQLCRGVEHSDLNLRRWDHPDSVVWGGGKGLAELPETQRSNQNSGQRKGKSYDFSVIVESSGISKSIFQSCSFLILLIFVRHWPTWKNNYQDKGAN